MRRMTFWISLLVLLLAAAASAAAQTPTVGQPETSMSPPTPPPSEPTVHGAHNPPSAPQAPDMVCFGYGPSWSVQFLRREARYLGINEPDQYFLGAFYWVANDKVWDWHREDGKTPPPGSYDLSASIQPKACKDPVRKRTYPYSAQVNLPTGDIVTGCCRKLRPGEAPIGKEGFPPSENTPNGPPTPITPAPHNGH